ncbi:hypothetical protein ACFC1R_30390 [Kitasatospora sp. NPDC056138]|uniref:hypothetical protein n=1 Tax=Kitasatospora sp. NPDC056138 TaxID=3345724 RepID=UPI0035D9E045
MLRDAVRGVVVMATGLAEETGRRVVGAATGLLERSGVDVAAIERTVNEQFPPSAKSLQTLAEDAVTAGRAGLDLALGAARSEVDKVFERVGDQVVKVGVVLSYLESKLREVEEQPQAGAAARPGARPEARAGNLFEAGWDERAPEPVEVDRTDGTAGSERPEPTRRTAAKQPASKQSTARQATAGQSAAKGTGAKPAVRDAAVKKAPAVKAGAGGTTGRASAATGKTATGKADAERVGTKKATAKKAPAKQTPVKKAAAKKPAAKKSAPKKSAPKKADDGV